MASGCATTHYSARLLESVSEPVRKLCEEFAHKNAEITKPSPSVGEVLQALILLPSVAPYVGAALLASPILVPQVLYENHRKREARYEEALKHCLEPLILEAKLGPDHPDVARNLKYLAYRFKQAEKYLDAEHYYRRVLAIQEKVLGPEHPDIADTLEDYASVLAKLHRQSEAEEAMARYLAIRDKNRHEKVSPEKNGHVREMVEADDIGSRKPGGDSETNNEILR